MRSQTAVTMRCCDFLRGPHTARNQRLKKRTARLINLARARASAQLLRLTSADTKAPAGACRVGKDRNESRRQSRVRVRLGIHRLGRRRGTAALLVALLGNRGPDAKKEIDLARAAKAMCLGEGGAREADLAAAAGVPLAAEAVVECPRGGWVRFTSMETTPRVARSVRQP